MKHVVGDVPYGGGYFVVGPGFDDVNFSVGRSYVSHDMGATFHPAEEPCAQCDADRAREPTLFVSAVDRVNGIVTLESIRK